jgi:outer membrane lipoprotein SlyB
MQFDVADLQTIFNDGRLNDVIMHEMHHVLGYGTVWNLLPVTGTPKLITNAGTPNTGFTGATAINACMASGGGQGTCLPTIPLENTGGGGTVDGHWRESIFKTELMTGFVSPAGVPNPLSQMTIGSMADLGYLVNFNVADNYSVGSAASFQLGAIRGSAAGQAIEEQLLYPRFEVTRSGGISPVPAKK